MKLKPEEIRSALGGCVRMEETGNGLVFHRFTEEEEEIYRTLKIPRLCHRCPCPAGMKLRFETDSPTLFLRVETERTPGMLRRFFSFDLKVNGVYRARLSNQPDDFSLYTPEFDLPQGEWEKTFSLGDGKKTVELYFPWSVYVTLKELSLADGSAFVSARPAKKMLAYGDSITQGYDVRRSSLAYATQLADRLGLELYNKAIGGEVMFPELAEAKQPFDADLITVAYGTNNWLKTGEDPGFAAIARRFYQNLRQNYPRARIVALSPIWRVDWQEERPFGPFSVISDGIRQAAKEVGALFVDGFSLVPHEKMFYSDLRVHPNDLGFLEYASNLAAALEKAL